jgi:hypothetical protein
LVGNAKTPTVLGFVALRANFTDTTTGETDPDFGLKLSWSGIQREEAATVNNQVKHMVAFRFVVSDTIYVNEKSIKLEPLTRLGTVLTLLLTAMSIMRFAKIFLQLAIDTCLRLQAQRSGTTAPEDVQRRARILEEDALTQKGSRRLSMVVGGGLGLVGEGGGKPNKQRRLSSRDLMQQDKTKPKKQRRLSSRELMQQDKGDTTADDIGIEMREFGFESSNGNVAYSNPLKKTAAGRGRRRHSSTSLSAFEEKTVNTKSVRGGERVDEMEQEMKKMKNTLEEQSRQIKLLLSMVATSQNAPVNREATEEDGDIEYFHDEESNRDYYIDGDGETQWKEQ